MIMCCYQTQERWGAQEECLERDLSYIEELFLSFLHLALHHPSSADTPLVSVLEDESQTSLLAVYIQLVSHITDTNCSPFP